MIPDFRTYIGESVWADIHRRSNGTQERKEDDINYLDMLGLSDYIQKKYEFKDKEIMVLSGLIGIPLFSYESSIVYLTISFISQDKIYDVYSRYIYDFPLKDSISSILKQKYLIKIRKESPISKYDSRVFVDISTKPKKGDIDNKFVIDVIDTYIDIMDTFKDKDIDKYIKRK